MTTQADCRLNEIAALMHAGDYNTAVKVSGEYLAEADGVFTAIFNAKGDYADAADATLKLGVAHTDALFAASEYREAFSLSLMLMLQASVTDRARHNAVEMLALCVIALSSLQHCVTHLAQDDFTKEHLMPIMRYLASLAFAYFKEVGKTEDENATNWQRRAYLHLHDLLQLVEEDTINVNRLQDRPLRPTQTVGDAIAHARALELFDVD